MYSKQNLLNSKLIVESCFQRSYWSNQYADSKYDILNNKWLFFAVVYDSKVNKFPNCHKNVVSTVLLW